MGDTTKNSVSQTEMTQILLNGFNKIIDVLNQEGSTKSDVRKVIHDTFDMLSE